MATGSGTAIEPAPRWAVFADAVLARAAVRRVNEWHRGIDPLAGSVIQVDDVGRLLRELPNVSLDAGAAPTVDDDAAALLERLAGDVTAARKRLHDPDGEDLLAWLTSSAGLDETAIEVLALAGAMAWSPARLRVLGYVQDDLTVRGLMVASIPALLDGPAEMVGALAPDAALRRACLVELDPPELTGTALVVVPPAVQWYLMGDESRDPALPVRAELYPGPPAEYAGRWLVHGPDRVRRLQLAAELAETTRLLVTPEPADDRGWAALVRTAVCRGFAVVLETPTLSATAGAWLQRADVLPWVVASKSPLPLEDVPPLPFVEREAASHLASAEELSSLLGHVPVGHRLRAEQLQLLTRLADLPAEHAVRRVASNELEQLTTRVRPARTWADLVLPPDRVTTVREVAERVRHRGRVHDEWGFTVLPSTGVVALFTGPPGTGKSLAAEIIAGDLSIDLFKIDLSAIVSKYIGETEQHLGRVFDAAEGGGVALLFDEADALFGRRTKVSDSHDRFANMEISYLLQRIEQFEGLTILTTNLASNIDEAFTRRIHVVVDFPMPGVDQRRAIWEASFPGRGRGLEVDVDTEFLAERFPLSGGSIRSAALTAAFSASIEGTKLDMHHVVYGLMREYQKLGRLINAADFGPWTDVARAQRSGDVDTPVGDGGGRP